MLTAPSLQRERARGGPAFWIHEGPSIYSRRPLIRYTFEADSKTLATDRSSIERLFSLLPGLREHRPCNPEALLAQESDRLARIPVPHLFEHLCIELQRLTGAELECVRTQGPRIAPETAVIPYRDESVALEAAKLAIDLVDSLAASVHPLDFERRLHAFLLFSDRWRWPLQDYMVIRAAEARDVPVTRIAGRIVQLGHGRHQRRMNGTDTTRTNIVSSDLAANKDYTRRLLRAVGLPVPAFERVHGREEAIAAANRIGFPVVVKPNRGNMGLGVSVGMRTNREVRDAYDQAHKYGRSSLVEEFIPGSDYRMLVIDGKLEAAAMRVAAHVVGDGVHTIEELVRQVNRDPRRGVGHTNSLTRIDLDDQADRLLADLGYDRASIAPAGEIVYLKGIANLSAGGTSVDVTDRVHPENRKIVERAARVIGLDVAGVDVLVRDIAQPMRAQGGVISEINSRPGLQPHLFPAEGKPRDVVPSIVEMLFPPGSPSRIPIAVVTGLGDRTSVARMLAELLAEDGSTVGLATDDGVFLKGKRVDGGGMDGPSAAALLLLDPTVDRAVLDVAPSEALEHGLGYDWADVCAVLGDEPIESPDLVAALQLVVSSTRRHVILSTGDEERYGLTPHPEARVWRPSPRGRGPAAYANTLARCLVRRDGDHEQANWTALLLSDPRS